MTAARGSGFFIKVEAAEVRELGPVGAITLSLIGWRAEHSDTGWRATYADIAAETGLPERTVRRACTALRDAGRLTAARAAADDATRVWSVVCAGQDEKANVARSEVANLAGGSGQSGQLPEVANLAVSSLETVETTTDTPSTPPEAHEEQPTLALLSVVPDAAPSKLDEEFDGFWRAYPRKVGKAKARTAYRSARKVASMDEIAAGLRAQLPDLRRREVHLVPHPTTWLNQRRWEDDPTHAAQPSGRGRNYEAEMMMARASGQSHDHQLGGTAELAIAMLEGRSR